MNGEAAKFLKITGKTTLARMIANTTDAHFIALSAVMAGIKDVRAAVQEANALPGAQGIVLPAGRYTFALAGGGNG